MKQKNLVQRIFRFKSLKKERLPQKFVLSFALSSIVPLLLALYIVYIVVWPQAKEVIDEVELIIFLMVCASMGGYLLNKRIVNSILQVARNSKAIADGDFSKIVKTGQIEQSEEVGELSEAFNRVTKRLRQNIEELEESKTLLQNILSKVGTAVTSFQDTDSLLELIVHTVTNALKGESGSLMLIDEQKKELFIKIATGLDSSLISKTRMKIGEGPIGWVVKENKPLILPSKDTLRFNKSEFIQFHRSFLCVPLVHSGRVIGALSISDKKYGDFNKDDLILLSNLAAQTAIAIENARLNEDAEKTYFDTITALAMAVEAKDPYTRGHSKRVVDYSVKLAEEFGLSDEEIEVLREAALLHDIGKIGISDAILHKKGALTPEEYELVKKHTMIGESIMKPIKKFSNLCDLVRHHQEWVNGEGYPDGLRGDEMSLSLKILMVADTFDAMTSNRPYRKALTIEQARAEFIKYSGTHFDKEVIDRFLKLLTKGRIR